MINRRTLITGLITFAAAPAIVRASSVMPVKVIKPIYIYEILDIITKAHIEELNKIVADDIMFGGSSFTTASYDTRTKAVKFLTIDAHKVFK